MVCSLSRPAEQQSPQVLSGCLRNPSLLRMVQIAQWSAWWDGPPLMGVRSGWGGVTQCDTVSVTPWAGSRHWSGMSDTDTRPITGTGDNSDTDTLVCVQRCYRLVIPLLLFNETFSVKLWLCTFFTIDVIAKADKKHVSDVWRCLAIITSIPILCQLQTTCLNNSSV